MPNRFSADQLAFVWELKASAHRLLHDTIISERGICFLKGSILYLSMMRRRWLGNSLIALLIAITCVFMLLYPGLIADSEEELTQAYDSIDVSGWLVNTRSYEDPEIPLTKYDTIVQSGYLSEYYSYSYCAVCPVEAAIENQCVADPAFRMLEHDEQYSMITGALLDEVNLYTNSSVTLYGLNDPYADATFARLVDGVEWLDGYDASIFSTDELVCICPSGTGVEVGDDIEYIIRKEASSGSANDKDIERVLATFKVVGIHTLTSNILNDPSNSSYYAYCPIEALRKAASAPKLAFSIRNLSFTVADNQLLDELKQMLVDIGLNNTDSGVRAAIDDRILIGTVSPIQKNIALLKGLHLFLYMLVVLMGFLLCFLTARGRKQEYAVMRLLGESRIAVTLKAIIEQIILCIVGIGVGLAATSLLPDKRADWFNIEVVALIALCYLVGAASAALATVRVDVMSILRDKE